MKKIIVSLLTFLPLAGIAATGFAEPYCRACPFSCSDLELGRKDCSFLTDTNNVCCLDLSTKGLKLAQAQEKVLNTNPPSVPTKERCPAGFEPSERKCSQEERRRGCKDMRLPGGLGCVRR